MWAAKGVVAVDIASLGHGWTVLVPATTETAVDPPYDEAIPVLLARPLPQRMRPGFGVVVHDGEAVLSVVARHLRAERRWLAWGPGEGLIRPGGLPVASLRIIVEASGVHDPDALAALRAVVEDIAGEPRDFLVDVLTVLGLPGGDLLDGSTLIGDLPMSRRVEPHGRAVAGFEGAVHEERLWHEELGL